MPARLGVTGSFPSGLSVADRHLALLQAPAIAWTRAPVFSTGGKFGGNALSDGTGTITFTIPPNGNQGPADQGTINGGILLNVPTPASGASPFSGTSDFLQIKDAAGNPFGFRMVSGGVSMNYDGLTDTGIVLSDGTWHQLGWELPSNYGGQQYNQVYLDAGAGKQIKFSDTNVYLHAGVATALIDMTQLPPGSLAQLLYCTPIDAHPDVPTALYAAKTPNHLLTLNLASDAVNIAVDPVSTTIGPAAVDGTSILADAATGALTSPYIIASYPLLHLPTDGSFFHSQINAFAADARTHYKSKAVLSEGYVQVGAPINAPDGISLEGTGNPNPYPGGYRGGTTITTFLNYNQPLVQAIGVNKGQDSSGMLQRIRLRNMAIFPFIQSTKAMTAPTDGSQAQQAALDIQNVAYCMLDGIWIGRDYARAVRLSNVWDSDLNDITITNSSGFGDPTVVADSAAWQQVVGRPFSALESKLGYSFGVPAFEIISPATSGGDVSNNLRIWRGRQESNASNGVPLYIHGPNAGMIQIAGWKIECNEGSMPSLVVEGCHNFKYDGWLMGGATGSPFNDTGGVKAGTPWANYQQAAIAIFKDCYSPRLVGGISHQSAGGKADALLRFIDTSNPVVDMTAEDGLDHCTVARMIFDNCRNVSRAHTRLFADNYVPGVGSIPERVYQTTAQSTQEEA